MATTLNCSLALAVHPPLAGGCEEVGTAVLLPLHTLSLEGDTLFFWKIAPSSCRVTQLNSAKKNSPRSRCYVRKSTHPLLFICSPCSASVGSWESEIFEQGSESEHRMMDQIMEIESRGSGVGALRRPLGGRWMSPCWEGDLLASLSILNRHMVITKVGGSISFPPFCYFHRAIEISSLFLVVLDVREASQILLKLA
ncbi:hypothetical protein B0T19DRAFT_208607 [Cercophora scortea]|uniref:Uncharacterized protein n=1 Tax=Cercophora scortea TaxID=314031 RepID=A0AAE0IE77_9PEZI|nr:hypothetical protein B0T19DRAFT_208607 [Cercophora scortea]